MSDALGMMAPAAVQHQYLEGNAYLDCSQETSAIVDTEVKKILESCFEESKKLLTENRQLLDEIAEYLLVKETITGEELMAFVNPPAAETSENPTEAATQEESAAESNEESAVELPSPTETPKDE